MGNYYDIIRIHLRFQCTETREPRDNLRPIMGRHKLLAGTEQRYVPRDTRKSVCKVKCTPNYYYYFGLVYGERRAANLCLFNESIISQPFQRSTVAANCQ